MMDEERDAKRDIWIGIGLSFLLNISVLVVGGIVGWLLQLALGPWGSLLVISLNGVGYITVMVLAVKEARRRGRPKVARGIVMGLIIQFALVLLLVAACFGFFFLLSKGWKG